MGLCRLAWAMFLCAFRFCTVGVTGWCVLRLVWVFSGFGFVGVVCSFDCIVLYCFTGWVLVVLYWL